MEWLGIGLSRKSSEIEGNTCTLLETVNWLKDKIEAKGKKRVEAIMLLNRFGARTAQLVLLALPFAASHSRGCK